MSSLYLKVETLAETSIGDAIKDGIELSGRLNVPIELSFNEVKLYITKGTNVQNKIAEYFSELKREVK
jgi:hypothetical protein